MGVIGEKYNGEIGERGKDKIVRLTWRKVEQRRKKNQKRNDGQERKFITKERGGEKTKKKGSNSKVRGGN